MDGSKPVVPAAYEWVEFPRIHCALSLLGQGLYCRSADPQRPILSARRQEVNRFALRRAAAKLWST
jgi:hypothetical protein